MTNTDTFLIHQEPALTIGNEVVYLDSLKDVHTLSTDMPVKMEYNAIVHCRKGRVLLEVGNNEDEVRVLPGQLLLVPAQKLMQSMMVSTDADIGVLLVSDHVLKRVLGAQIDIWNRAMYLHNTYVIGWQWNEVLPASGLGMFENKNLLLFNDIVIGFLRILLLMICEELLKQENLTVAKVFSNDRDKTLFHQFLDLLSHEKQKRRQVNYYAEKLCITPKYLSTVCRKPLDNR